MIEAGFVNIHKPLGITAHDCVAQARKLLHTPRIGHSGTLDPMATGVLPIAVNQATRLLQFLPQGKAYHAVIRFGQITSTDDREGEILQDQPSPALTLDRVREFLPQFIGALQQRPPAYSAIKVKGKRLYAAARAGEVIEAPLRPVEVYDLEILHWQGGQYPELSVGIRCGAGTYIRSLARDLGETIGCGAMLAALERTASNGFLLLNSTALNDISPENLIPPDRPLEHLEAVNLLPEEAKRWLQGQKIIGNASRSGIVRVYTERQFLGIAKTDGVLLLPLVVLNH